MSKKLYHLMTVKLTAIFLVAVLLSGCGSDKKKTGSDEITLDENEFGLDLLEDITSAKQIFYSLPSPLETAMLIKSAGAAYNEELLNQIRNASKSAFWTVFVTTSYGACTVGYERLVIYHQQKHGSKPWHLYH